MRTERKRAKAMRRKSELTAAASVRFPL